SRSASLSGLRVTRTRFPAAAPASSTSSAARRPSCPDAPVIKSLAAPAACRCSLMACPPHEKLYARAYAKTGLACESPGSIDLRWQARSSDTQTGLVGRPDPAATRRDDDEAHGEH